MADKEKPKMPQVPAPAPAQTPASSKMTESERLMLENAKRDAFAKRMRDKYDQGEPLGDKVESRKKGGKISSASSRADGIASRGKTRGTIVRMG